MRGQTPDVPQQTNYSDCGVFVLQYVETFFEVWLHFAFVSAHNCVWLLGLSLS